MDAGQTSKRPNSDKKDDDRNVRRCELYKLMMANEKLTELPLFPAFDNENPHSIYEKGSTSGLVIKTCCTAKPAIHY
ncbi:hypothetical protein H5410_038465 [Solanum commersonii]|uniref:Uncharacterized protein n=1 Tax=Solanum commersonii TaxID=4109 RepID=A0A9J5YA61_SOLCO|nr:hypothetical protein H5410_038465 [Solanum commersonii]